MANPQSSIPNAQLPFMTQQVTAPDGTPTLLFHRFLTGLWQRTGGASGINNSDVQLVASEAFSLATQAGQAASAASSSATIAENTANAALAAANTANTAAQTAQTTASAALTGALRVANNLSDLSSVSVARSNLGLAMWPLTVSFDSCPASLHRGIPLTRPLTVPASFAGTVAWWGIAATGTATFNVGYATAPSSSITPIGTIRVVAGTGIQLSPQAAVTLAAGSSLVITCPASPDATLAEVSFTIPMVIV